MTFRQKQNTFLVRWGIEISALVQEFTDEQHEMGEDVAYSRFVDRCQVFAQLFTEPTDDNTVEVWEQDLRACALMYVDLMIRRGVFSDDLE